MIKELTENTYLEALLRAALVLGDLERKVPVRELTIAGYRMDGETRRLYPRCKMISQDISEEDSKMKPVSAFSGEDYLILYRI